MVQALATQHVHCEWLGLFREAIVGGCAACAADCRGWQLLCVMASEKRLCLAGPGWTLLPGVYSAIAHLGTKLQLSV